MELMLMREADMRPLPDCVGPAASATLQSV
jgi:hypothetical protein